MLEIARAAAEPTPAVAAPPAPADAPWSLPRRVGFRFAFAFTALWLLPFPIGTLPYTQLLGRPFDLGWDALTAWVGRLLLHRPIDTGPNGSGDSSAGWLQLALTVVLALVATAAWSALDRRRRAYPRLQQWLHVYLRFAVGAIMVSYGTSKIYHTQFPFPSTGKLEQAYGDASPMGLLWTFMGFSGPYNVFTGLAETVPALLLFFRRTATLGALLLAAVMANVVMLNFCYDVPVKIFSTELLLASLYIAGPRLRAIFDVVVGERSVAAYARPPLFARPRLALAARIAGVAFAAYVLGHQIVRHRKMIAGDASASAALAGFAGNWDVVTLTRDGQPVPATLGEKTRWKSLSIRLYKGSGSLAYKQMDDYYDRWWFNFDAAKKTLALETDTEQKRGTLVYAQPDADHLTLTGTVDGHAVVMELCRRPAREYRLVTRGFHWVNEAPYNR